MITKSKAGVVSHQELLDVFQQRHGPESSRGWNPRMLEFFGYFSPDVFYETTVSKVVESGATWLDVGCGKDVFPSNRRAASVLSTRVSRFVGVDPSPNIHLNQYVHDRFQGLLEEYETADTFDVITLRMVAEHVEDPQKFASALQRLTHKNSQVVIYTVNYWSMITLVSALVPFGLHHPIKKLLWRTKEEDTFPVAYKMNTRGTLRRLMERHGFEETGFSYLSDCRSLARWKVTQAAELVIWKMMQFLGMPYFENCLLGVYRRK